MLWFVIILLLILFSDMKVAPAGGFLDDYMAKKQNNCIKGIFIILIIFSHYSGYFTLEGPMDLYYGAVRDHINQGVVAMFFTYSGYGMMESIKRKGFPYVKAIPGQRLLKVWFNFAVAVVVFLIIAVIFHKSYPVQNIILSFTGYSNVGNSSWYMFAIFVLYILTFLAFLVLAPLPGKGGWYLGTVLLTILTVAVVYWQIYMERPMYAFDTMILFPFGFWYSLLREKIEKIVQHSDITFFAALSFFVLLYAFSYMHRWDKGILTFTPWIFAFTVVLMLMTMKVSFESPVLEWFGKNLFWVYILQRIPMNILSYMGVVGRHRYFALVISIVVTVFLTVLFDKYIGRLSTFLFDRKKVAETKAPVKEAETNAPAEGAAAETKALGEKE